MGDTQDHSYGLTYFYRTAPTAVRKFREASTNLFCPDVAEERKKARK